MKDIFLVLHEGKITSCQWNISDFNEEQVEFLVQTITDCTESLASEIKGDNS